MRIDSHVFSAPGPRRRGALRETKATVLLWRTNRRRSCAWQRTDAQSERLAWHAVATTGIGPGVTPGAEAEAVLRQAVTEALLGFPPR